MKEEEVENKSLNDLEKIICQAELYQVPVVIIGGYAVRSYTPRIKRYTKDIDITVGNREDMNKLTGALKKIGYQVKERNHQRRTAFRRVEGTPISVNIILERVESTRREITSYYEHEPVDAPVALPEDIVVLKAEAGRERDIIDICILLLDSLDSIKPQKLKSKAKERGSLDKVLGIFKFILDSIDSKEFRSTWKSLMGKKINKNQERKLWNNTTSILKDLQE